MEIGTLRDCMSLDLQKKMADIMTRKGKDKNYYLLVYAQLDPLDRNRVNTKIITSLIEPPKMLGTFCVYVNNRSGHMEPRWSLPLDIPHFGVTDIDKIDPETIESGKKMQDIIVY